MRFPILSSAENLLSWANRLVMELNRDEPATTGVFMLSDGLTTTVANSAAKPGRVVFIQPTTGTAVDAKAYVAEVRHGSFIVGHVPASVGGRFFGYVIH